VLQLAATDGFLTVADRATVTVDPDPSIVGANLLVALATPGPLVTGTLEAVTATLTDGLGAPIANFAVQLTVAGANPVVATAITNASGVASFAYTGTKAGTDVIHATALGSTFQLDSAAISLSWTEPATAGPILTQGWIASPGTQTPVMGQVPIVLAPDVTLASGTITYWPASTPSQVHTLAAGITGAPGATLATFDTTVLANGSYVIRLDGTNDAGTERISQVLVTATGDYKPGRVVVELTDLTIPIAGLPITVGRRYDSLEKDNVGDFGHGWSLLIGHPKLEVDPANNVTITMPDNRRVTFYFEPQFPQVGPVVLGFFLVPAYVPEPGVFGKLTSDGCSLLSFNPSAVDPTPICLDSILDPTHLDYAPTTYTYTDAYGRQFVMARTGELKSIKDRQGNTLTFQPNGIISGTGKAVSFNRDPQGRITNVTSPAALPGTPASEWSYSYDDAGDLVTVSLPPSDGLVAEAHHTYADHRLLTTIDPRGNPARTSTYDLSGRLATDTDALGNVTSYAYELAARTTRSTQPDTGVITQVYDDRGLVLSETDPLGRTTTHEYDANRNETARTNAANERTVYTYDAKGSATSATDSVHRTIRATYNEFEQPTTVTDGLGHTSSLDYDARGVTIRLADEIATRFSFSSSERGLPLTVDDAVGNRAYITYDATGNVTSRTDWLGRITGFTYDELGRPLTHTTPRGGVSTNFYTARGQVFAQSDPALAGSGLRTFTHDQNDNVTADAWPLGRQTQYTYDALNRVTREVRADGTLAGSVRQYTRDFRGNKLTETDEAGRTTTNEYDLAGELTKTTFPDGTKTIRTYDALGRLASLTDERGNTTTYEYDAGCSCSDRVTRVTDPLGHATVTTYDAAGQRASVTDAAGHTTTFTYGVRHDLVDTRYADGTATHNTYDIRGRRISTTDQANATTLFSYDEQGQLTSISDPLGNVTTYVYDPDGNLASVTDANGHKTSYEYDFASRKTKRTLPLGNFETFTYDALSRLIGHTDFRGKTTTKLYDTLDRLSGKNPDPSLGEPTVSYSYNPTGTRASMTDASGVTAYTYDQRDRLLTKATSVGTLTYTYDPSGNVATLRSSNANGTSVDYTWDAANELVSVTDNRVGGTTDITYSATKRPLTLTQPNGIGLTYAYDLMDRIASMLWSQGASSAFGSWTYTRNERGQQQTATDITGRRVDYGYDAASRLTRETISGATGGSGSNGEIAYVLDGLANRISRNSAVTAVPSASYSYDANDQVITDGYDANGNTVSFGGHSYAYDFENRLVSKDAGSVTLQYNCDGDRVGKTVGGVTTRYLVDDLNPTGYQQVLEEIVGDTVQTRYTYGIGPISQTRNASTAPATSYYGFDANGNVTFLTDGSGSITDSYDYDASGILVARAGGTQNTRLYAGEEFDPDLGFINLRARQYNPNTGRFITVDPLDPATSTGVRDEKVIDAISAVAQPQLRAVLDVAVSVRVPMDQRAYAPANWNHFLYANGDAVNLHDPTGRGALEYAIMASRIVLFVASAFDAINVVHTLMNNNSTPGQREHAAFGVICTVVADSTAVISDIKYLGIPGFVILGAALAIFCIVAHFTMHE